MGAEDEPQNTTWGGQWRRSLRSGSELDLVRSWNRRIECPACKAVAGRACRTEGGHPTNHHRARRDAAGPLPYEKWRQQGLIPPPRIYTMPAILEEVGRARTDFNLNSAMSDGIAVVRTVLAERLGMALGDEAAMDRIDEAVRKLLEVRGPVGSADLVTVLASLTVMLLSMTAGQEDNPDALFDALIRAQVDGARALRAVYEHRPEG
ncbi:hypothetical protein ACIOHH_36405 [Streptomyces microflavus]|uniref:zinc finger domain-containing protein n=1 Tax=Streptomyces microflavus TaxID=1919 RepID=UPI0038008A04